MATFRDAPRSPSLIAPSGATYLELGSVEEVEEVDVDDDVSAADLTGEALLPTGDVLADEEPAARTISMDPEHTAPRAPYPSPLAPVAAAEPLGEPTVPQLDATSPAGIREQARLAAGSLADEDVTGETPLPAEPPEPPGTDLAPEPFEPLTPLAPALPLEDALRPAVPVDEVVLSGSLAAVPLIDVLGLLGRQRQTGVLTVAEEGRRIDITLQGGQVALATGQGFEDLRLGRFVVEMDAAAPTEIDELASAPAGLHGNEAPIGARLCQLGYLSRDDLRHALSRQSQELIYEALRLRRGRFLFSQPAALPPLAVDRALGANLRLDLEAMLLEGYRRIHDWHLVEAELDEGAVYMRSDDRGAAGERVGLTREEQQVLSLCTGRNAISDIARDSRLGALDVVRILQRLQAVNLVRRRLPPQAV